ncbi:hypothetical protein B0T24DRAFT_708314 [Lasiosphaeria ovina]|uniref:Uncharacterized protein n=1 Tax=Lasiosphaeria ovina TaxID=92902 RepID=A0AAE0K547_9PEZI|nr:hypothetical protein B0T24DRAFT_708314 [Lasiosphaeria ovina]
MSLSAPVPGIFWVSSGVLPAYKDALPYNNYVKWYENVHIPDWMGAKAGAITTAWRYQSADARRPTPFLVTYKYPDVAALAAPEFLNVTLTDPALPGGGPVNKVAQFIAMAGPHVETWKSGSTGDERGPILVTEAIEPSFKTNPVNYTDFFEDWYHDTYIGEVSRLPGWRRTSRFNNTMAGGPRLLALHEFDESAFDANATKIPGLLGISADTKYVQGTAKSIEMALWRLVRVYGDGTVPWGEPWEDKIV